MLKRCSMDIFGYCDLRGDCPRPIGGVSPLSDRQQGIRRHERGAGEV